MKTASIREVKQNLSQLLAWVKSGQEVTITSRSKPVARLVAIAPEKKLPDPDWPSVVARQRKLFLNKPIKPDAVAAEREGYRW